MSAKALRQHYNVWADKYFAIAIGALMPAKDEEIYSGTLSELTRFLAQSVLGVQIGRWCLYSIYWVINLACTLTNLDLHNHINVAKRLGWISVANFVLLVFLALRNTPLAPLSGRSYEKLRPLHKTAGYTCIVTSILHAIVYLSAWAERGDVEKMRETENLAGGIAGLAMVIIGISTIGWFTRRFYEVFYMIHLVLFLLIIITVGMHRPLISRSTLVIIIFTACMWFSDRLLRFVKLCCYFPGNHATLKLLPNGALRVTLSRNMCASTSAGSHAYLWIPAIRCFETHPFTLVSSSQHANQAEFLINVYDGFTHDLHKIVMQNPGISLRCSVDGAYGQIPDFSRFDRILLVAGGSGASFSFAVALDVIRKCAGSGGSATKMIDFVWSVKHYASLSWFERELAQLQESSHVRVFIHITQEDAHPESPQDILLTKLDVGINTNNLNNTGSTDIEKTSAEPDPNIINSQLFSSTHKGRPDVLKYISSFVDGCSPEDRVGVGACGPVSMVDSVMLGATRGAYDDGPSITVHTEEFGW
ncbi:putative ferric reductase transmembrane component [Talaromyces islandicus]|uniref:ferric-chelate reductase (NADPH) n=1 Tax=Talaromyces islandicus TaxID=28573 RepID=A0A0U1LT06_TALIS|nr:putative ferric reductase transmembrane component [Talaromyces islandicus]